ncbi:hypothetical protein NMY22_g3282 [Coprinellus aureogranulatus]|nr:hypothetical protein NMY22_g3282 [Coprinellus aureogranulatus]
MLLCHLERNASTALHASPSPGCKETRPARFHLASQPHYRLTSTLSTTTRIRTRLFDARTPLVVLSARNRPGPPFVDPSTSLTVLGLKNHSELAFLDACTRLVVLGAENCPGRLPFNARTPIVKRAPKTIPSRFPALHQFFLVAQVRPEPGGPKEYRCVAAFNHGWCYGSLPLRAVHRFRRLAKVKANANLIQRDLDRYHLGSQHRKRIPCPYISFLASSAFSNDIERDLGPPYLSGVSYLPATMGSMDGDDDDGITVMDISTLSEIQYCFVSTHGLSCAENDEVPRRVPLTATEYLGAYYPMSMDPLDGDEDQEAEVYNAKCLDHLDDVPVLTLDVLAATWPHEYARHRRAAPCLQSSIRDNAEISSLQSRIESGAVSLRESQGESQDDTLDLSKRDIKPTEMLDVLRASPYFTRLDISSNPAVDKTTLAKILEEHRLKWLNVDGCSISNEDMTDLLASQSPIFRGVEAIIHPLFLAAENLDQPCEYPTRVEPPSIPSVFRVRYDDGQRVCLPFFSVDSIAQSLLDFAEAHEGFSFESCDETLGLYFQNLHCLFGSTPCGDERPWGERIVQMILPHPCEKDNGNCYQFVFISSPSVIFCPGGRSTPIEEGPNYGIILPGGEDKFVGLATFFDHLVEEGWPKPTKAEAVSQVIKLFHERTTLLEDFDDVMNWLNNVPE